MRKRAKMRLAVLGGMIAGAVAGCWLLDMLEAAANWMLVHWMGLDLAGQPPGPGHERAAALWVVWRRAVLILPLGREPPVCTAGPAAPAVRKGQPQPCPHGRAGLLDR